MNVSRVDVNHPAVKSVWNKGFIGMLIMNLFLMMGLFMMNVLVPTYAAHLGATAAIVGLVTGILAITALAVRPIVGPSTRYFRNNRLLAGAVFLTILAFICYGLAESITLIVIGRLLHGMGMGFFAPVSMALVSNTLPPDKLASGIGIFSLGGALATALGPSFGLALVDRFGYQTTFFIGALIMTIAMLLPLLLKSELPPRNSSFHIRCSDIIAKEVLIVAVIMFFLSGAYSCVNYFIVLYGQAAGVKEIGLFFTSYSIFLFISRPFSGRIADKYGVDKILIPGIIIFALSFLLLSFSQTLPMFILTGAVLAFGFGICQPTIQTLCIQLVPVERRGVAGNTAFIGTDIGYLIAPFIAGIIVTLIQNRGGTDVSAYAIMYRWMMIPIIVAFFLFMWKRKEILMKIK